IVNVKYKNVPLVTGAGDQTLFTSFLTSLAQQLPREPMEWRRMYGRAPKMIHLEANFVQFKEELLPKKGNKALLTFPFLHIYWTDCCDTETYKTSVKEDMMRWQNSLRAHGSVDWVIVVVESNDSKKKNKANILPRSSILDKIRSDFCNKQNDRCVVLLDPLKESSRSQDSWNSMLLKLRTLLLMSFTKNLGRFEDDMRTLREKRTQPGWSFCEYFMVQEELAFVFEMLQQFEDALVQYDELDALFTQYVLNFGAGDAANWLGSFCAPVRNWGGLLLRRPIDMEKRDLIQRGEANLLDLRSYLFSRQCTLLIFLQRPWEVTHRALELLHNCVQELRLLEVSVLDGALDCWVFLSCLEVLHRIEGCCDPAQLAANSTHTVGLWVYAIEKLKSLGDLCGLMSEKGPTSEDLNRTVDLLAGLGDERPETVNSLQSPYKKLKEALSSVEAFERHYLELSHAALETYQTIGRLRSARLIGKSLAEFYMRKGDPEQAEPFLKEALKSYVSEGWSLPVTHTRKQVAECQKLLGRTDAYLQTSALLAGDVNLTTAERQHFCQEILNFPGKSGDKSNIVTLSMDNLTHLSRINFHPATASVHSGAALEVELILQCLMPMPVRIQQLAASIYFALEQVGTNGRSKAAQRQTSGGTVEFPRRSSSAAPPSSAPYVSLELEEIHDRSPTDNSLNSTGVVCKNTHLVIRRHDSSSPADTPSNLSPAAVTMKEGAQMLKVHDVTLQPGTNSIMFTAPCGQPGVYMLRQLYASVGHVQFVLPHIYPSVQYEVYSQEPQLTVEPLSEPLLAGLPQTVKFTVLMGHYSLKKGDALQFSNTETMPILPSSSCTAHIRNPAFSCLTSLTRLVLVGESVLSIQSSEKVTSISLPLTPPYHTLEFKLEVLCVIPSGSDQPNNERLTNGEVRHRPLIYWFHVDKLAVTSSACPQMSIDCPWSIYSTLLALTFYVPFKTKHSLLSAGNRSYIQVCVQNVSDINFKLADMKLSEKQHNTSGARCLCKAPSKHSVFCLWEVRWKDNLPSCLQCVFSTDFSPLNQDVSLFKLFHHQFQLERVTTLYSVRAEILPPAGEQHCRCGLLCKLEVFIKRLSEPAEGEMAEESKTDLDGLKTTKLMYQVADSNSNWAVCGKSSGLVSMPVATGSSQKMQIEVMPLFAGHLPYPRIKVLKYLPHTAGVFNQPDPDSCMENDSLSLLDDQVDTASIRSRGSVHSVGSSDHQQKGIAMPRLDSFGPGEVFNHSHMQQVLVLPATDDHIMEVNAT
uniref:Trafficking protein particle complex subunit 10 n=1 Tax=Takifugu rubripes TaxID=31033 RepID=A0A674NBW7_TAKRU